jgi:hypothetical protein
LCPYFAPKRTSVDVVDERALAPDLDHREPLAVARLQPGVAGDVDLLELEGAVLARRSDDGPCALAQVTALRVVDRDVDYG